jgi:choline kinase/phosphatidylglycerophosphate synthase
MVSNPIHQAVVLATATADLGGRARPLALVKAGGITQIRRTLLVLKKGGVRRFVVVTGRADAAIRRHVAADPQLAALDIVWVRNAERPDDDGHSLLRARGHVRGDFFLVSVDRVFPRQVLDALLVEPLDGVTLAIERGPAALPAGALTVEMGERPSAIARIGDGRPDAVFTGIATADRRLLDELYEMRQRGERPELSGAIARLGQRGLVRAADIQGAFWRPVRNEPERKEAQRMLVASLRKSVDGVVARYINRRFSLAVTRLLMHLPVRPNHVTAFSLVLSLAAAVTAALATASTPLWLLVGAGLWQLASMMDGVDGELARLKFTESKIGEWFDTITDDIGRVTFFSGFGIGVSAVTGEAIWLQLALMSVAMQVVLCVTAYRKLIKTGSGSHYALNWDPADGATSTLPERILRKIEFMARRNWYVLVLLVLVIIGAPAFALFITFLTTSLAFGHELFRPRQARETLAVRSGE